MAHPRFALPTFALPALALLPFALAGAALKRRGGSLSAPMIERRSPAGFGPAGLGPAGLGPAGLGPAGFGRDPAGALRPPGRLWPPARAARFSRRISSCSSGRTCPGGSSASRNGPSAVRFKPLDLVADAGQEAANLAVAAFGQHDLQQRAVAVLPDDLGRDDAGKTLGQPHARAAVASTRRDRACRPLRPGTSFRRRSADASSGWPARRRWSPGSTPRSTCPDGRP